MSKIVKDKLLNELVSSVCGIYGDNLISVILYGSVARNTATEDSDIDIALLVKQDIAEMHDKMLDVMVDLDLEYDEVIFPSLIEQKKYEEWRSVLPYYRNIENEGIVLWTAA